MPTLPKTTDLGKYLRSLPSTEITILLLLIVSFMVGVINGIFLASGSFTSIIYTFLTQGTTTFFLFGMTSLASYGIVRRLVNLNNTYHMKTKQAVFLSFICMLIMSVFYISGTVLTLVTGQNIDSDVILLGIIIAFIFHVLVIYIAFNFRYIKAITISLVQPVITICVLIIIYYLISVSLSLHSLFSVYSYGIVVAIIFVIVVYCFIYVIQRPFKNNLGVNLIELLSLFLAHFSEESLALESIFDDMGEDIDTSLSLVSFKTKNGNIKANYISPCVHPGPVGTIGGSNLPTIVANQLDDFAIIVHGAATHDFNPVTQKELKKISNKIKEVLPTLEYQGRASKFYRVQSDDAKIGYQFFNDGVILLSTFAPLSGDDISYGVGLSLMYEAKSVTGANEVVFVDCHNSLEGNYDKLLSGQGRVVQLENAVNKIQKPELYPIRMGCLFDPLEDITVKDGIGNSGLKLMLTEVDDQLCLYVVFDGNNMKIGYRDRIINEVKDTYPQIDMVEVMTTDTHFVNTVAGGVTVGTKKDDEILKSILDLIPKVIDDLEEVEVATKTTRINIKTMGPEKSAELITTINSAISISISLVPFVLLIVLIIMIISIFPL